MSTAYVNGRFLPLEDATVSVLDRGLLFADSVYEVIPVYAGRAFCLARHLERLQHSLDGLRIPNPHDAATWTDRINALIEANGSGDLSVYLQVTRGAPPRRDHRLPADPEPTVIAFCQSRSAPDASIASHGIDAVIQDDTRWRYCAIKSTSLLANVLAADAARNAGASEAILVRDGTVLEGTSSNVFAVIDGRLVTPALRDAILPGITRKLILELAARHALDHDEVQTLTPDALRAADEVWITSSTREMYPVTRLDGAPVGDGRPGPVWTRVQRWLQAATHD